MKVAIYTRVSTDSEEQINSLSNQKEYYLNYTREQGYEMVKLYADEGLTGTNMKREHFLEMIHDAGLEVYRDQANKIGAMQSKRKPKFNRIITKDVSRFARNTNVTDVLRELSHKGVYVYFQNQNIDTEQSNWEFLVGLFLNFAQQESIDRSSKVRFGLQQRATDGKYHFSSERLYGYQYDKDTKEISVISEEAEVVKRVFDMYIGGLLGSRKIADTLNNEGLTTQNGKKWNANGIVRMLKQEKYTGKVALMKHTYGNVTYENRQKKLREKDQWVYHNDILPPIIEMETYLKAQEIMSGRTTENRGTNTPRNAFSKKLKCAKCGKNYIRSSQKQGGNTYYFYACATKRRTKECDNQSITLLRLEKEMEPYQEYKLYKRLNEYKDTLNKMIKNTVSVLEMKKKMAETKKKSIRSQIDQKQIEVDNIITSFSSSSETVKNAVNRKVEQLEAERTKLELELLNYDEVTIDADIREYTETMNHINKAAQQKREFTLEEVLSFVRDITIDGNNVKINFTFENLLPKDGTGSMREYMLENVKVVQAFIKDMRETINPK
jgi:site-specific DNA recombinase